MLTGKTKNLLNTKYSITTQREVRGKKKETNNRHNLSYKVLILTFFLYSCFRWRWGQCWLTSRPWSPARGKEAAGVRLEGRGGMGEEAGNLR